MVLDIPVAYEPKEVAEILRKTGGMSEDVIAKVSTEITMGVPVKELLLIQEMARSDSKDGVIDYETYMDCFHSVHPDLWCVCCLLCGLEILEGNELEWIIMALLTRQ